MKSLWSIWVPLLVLWFATRSEIFAISPNPASVSGSTGPSTDAHEPSRHETPAGPGLLYRFWTPSSEVRAAVDQAVDITADVITTLLGLLPWFFFFEKIGLLPWSAVLRFQEGTTGIFLMHMMIAHVVSAFCNYVFLTGYGIVLIAMKGTYYIVGLHICITSGLCCMNFVSLIVFLLVRYKYLFKVSCRFMILVIIVATVPPTVSVMICFILHFLTARSIQINVLGSMAIICTILMYLTRYFTLVGYKWWALVVAAVGIVNGLLWIVHFDHDIKLPYKIASSVGAAGRMIELIMLLYYSQHPPVLHDIESQLLGDLDNKSGDNGGDHANENKNACPPPLIILHEKMNDHSDGQLLGSANLAKCEMKAVDSPLGARNCTSIPSHVPSTASSPTVGALQESLKDGQVKVADDDLFPPKLGPSVNGVFDEEMIKSSDMSLEDTSDVKDLVNEDSRSTPSPPPASHENNNRQNYGGSSRWDDLPKSDMNAPDSTLGAGNFGLVPSHNLATAIGTPPTVATHDKPLKVEKELGTEDCIPHPPRDEPVLHEAIGEETTESFFRDREETTESSNVSLEDASEVTNIINQVPETVEVTK